MASKLVNSEEEDRGVTVITEPLQEDPSAVEELHLKPAHDITRALWTIVGGVALPCIPILIITTVLLYYIFRHRLILSSGVPELQTGAKSTHSNVIQLLNLFRNEGGDKAYYVQYNASTITTIASWTGRVVPYLSSSIMALVAFYAARHVVLMSKHGDGSNLPSPEQFTLLISVLGGSGFGPLRDTLLYRYGKGEKLIAPLPAACAALCIITFLGLLIPIIDSWFGIATTTVTVTQLYPSTPTLSYGRGISESICPNGPRDNGSVNQCYYDTRAWWPCNIVVPICHGIPVVPGVSEASKISQGVSQTNEVRNYTDATGKVYYYLGDPAQSANLDYQARTVATSSSCVPMTKACYPDPETMGHDFKCTPGFTGSFLESLLNKSATVDFVPTSPVSVGLAFSGNAELTQVGGMELGHLAFEDYNWTLPEIYTTNPLYTGVWAIGYPPADPSATVTFAGDTGIIYDTSDPFTGGKWLLNCSTSVHEVSYTWVNGSVAQFNHSLASTDLSALLSAPFAMAPDNEYMYDALTSIATVAGSGNTSHAIAESFAGGFSRGLLAYSIGAMRPVLNEYEQARNSTILVARIPVIPLWLLVATKAIYVLAVNILAIGAYCFTHPGETEFVKAQLSVQGLAAAHFRQPEMAQQSVAKVLQHQLDVAKGKSQSELPPAGEEPARDLTPREKGGIRRAATAPVYGSETTEGRLRDARVGLLPGADGAWQFVVVANGVWNSIKPIVENFVVTDAASGGLGTAGKVINAWQ